MNSKPLFFSSIIVSVDSVANSPSVSSPADPDGQIDKDRRTVDSRTTEDKRMWRRGDRAGTDH